MAHPARALNSDAPGLGSGDPSLSARVGAARILQGYMEYEEAFRAITARAAVRFGHRDWHGIAADARERLVLYASVVDATVEALSRRMAGELESPDLWSGMRAEYAARIVGHPSSELAETFFNSLARRALSTVGIDPDTEFLDFQFERVPVLAGAMPYRTYVRYDDTVDLVRRILGDLPIAAPYSALSRDAEIVARRIEHQWDVGHAPVPFENVEVLGAVFYRRKGAYLIGRVRGGSRVMPLVLALTHGPGGIVVDAVLVTERAVSIVFSFTRSYFHAEVRHPGDVIRFLRSLMPVKPVAELYAALGHHKHGKTQFYRDLRRHLERGDEQFDIAPGARGMVMAVFAMPGHDFVFKVIRDRFAEPKRATRAEVRRRYRLVFEHDRAGRLVDAQLFQHLVLPRARFTGRLLQELEETATRDVAVEGDDVVLRHVYLVRRVRPLDLHLASADPTAARRAVYDYGQAIRDLAATDVFPGDLLLKNFGVTRHGRVVFYDYDELCLLNECVFREMPEPRTPEEEMADEPWYHVGPRDVFPEELRRFLQFAGAQREAYLERHGALYGPEFWHAQQARTAAGDVIDVFPYGEEHRLTPSPSPFGGDGLRGEDDRVSEPK